MDGFTASQGKKELAGQELEFDESLLGTHAILFFDLNGYTSMKDRSGLPPESARFGSALQLK